MLVDDAAAVDLFDLIEPNSRGFSFPGWAGHLAHERCFRVVGLDYVLNHFGIPHAALFDKPRLSKLAITKVPRNWKREFPATADDWEEFKRDQFSYAHHSLPIKLNKACIALLMACAALDERNINFPDIFSYVKICPQTYTIDGFDSHFYNSIVRNTALQTELLLHSRQNSSAVLENISRNAAVTWMTAATIRDFLRSRGHTVQTVLPLSKKPKARVSDEVVIYDPTRYGLAPLAHGQGQAVGQP